MDIGKFKKQFGNLEVWRKTISEILKPFEIWGKIQKFGKKFEIWKKFRKGDCNNAICYPEKLIF